MPAETADPMAEHKRRARWRLLGALVFSTVVAAVVIMLFEDTPRPLKQDFILRWPTETSAVDAAQPPVAAEAPAPVATKAPSFYVQAGAYAQRSAAEAVQKKLEASGRRITISSTQTAGGPRYRVRLGPYASERDADATRARLKLQGYDATLVRPEAPGD
ncbi:MAG: SPOR domain-containing protein [Proteobacteria bacterium]|jgi:cell division protein FtsN|nr:SPOR domain-containing protein [Pseudomonadota bacterium]